MFGRTVRTGLGAVPLLQFLSFQKISYCEEAKKKTEAAKKWKIFRKEEIAKHTTPETGIWVTYKDGVYNITDFVNDHPGGRDKIMLGAGKSIDPFWRIYQQHTNRGNAVKLLEALRIGTLDPQDIEQPKEEDLQDPFCKDPVRHPALIWHNNKPCNFETPRALLDTWITPNELWFIRHHHPVPIVDPNTYRLSIKGDGAVPIELTLHDLRDRFDKHEVTTSVQCGGNRRSGLNKVEETSGIPWGPGAISTAKFGGVLLRDVLKHSGLLTPKTADKCGVKHVIFEGHDDMQASIPIEKALSAYGDVLIAYEMNGEEIPRDHGYPVRIVVPGHVGVRNVKWVHTIRASKEEATGPWQRGIAYKGFSPAVKSFKEMSSEDIEKILSMQEQPVNSVIVSPTDGSKVEMDSVTVKGYAYSGGGRGIVRVDVSIDGGENWLTAELTEGGDQHPTKAWAWTFWEIDVDIPEHLLGKELSIVCKATDSSYNVQPETVEAIWNARGLNNTSWDRVKIQHVDD